ncbi:MAG: hypothetical protein RLZZ117_583 [Cyanobacteriota bacterium]|jgi:hypothetical protein
MLMICAYGKTLNQLHDMRLSPQGSSRPSKRFVVKPLLVSLASLVAGLTHLAPANAYEVFFNAPNVLGGIRNVSITLPSTGVTGLYDVILRQGTLADVYGSPPIPDLDNATDAQALMEASATGINAYLNATIGTPLSFAVSGEPGYVIPYGPIFSTPTGEERIGVSISVPRCLPGFYWDPVANVCRIFAGILERAPQIIPELGELSPLQITVWADVQPVPAPLPLAGGLAAWSWGRTLRRRCASARSLT